MNKASAGVKPFGEEKRDILYPGLSLVFLVLCALHIVLIALGEDKDAMWSVFASMAIMLLLLHPQRNMLSVLAIVALSTYVADEDFLLEMAAIYRGESLLCIRAARQEAPLPGACIRPVERGKVLSGGDTHVPPS